MTVRAEDLNLGVCQSRGVVTGPTPQGSFGRSVDAKCVMRGGTYRHDSGPKRPAVSHARHRGFPLPARRSGPYVHPGHSRRVFV